MMKGKVSSLNKISFIDNEPNNEETKSGDQPNSTNKKEQKSHRVHSK